MATAPFWDASLEPPDMIEGVKNMQGETSLVPQAGGRGFAGLRVGGASLLALAAAGVSFRLHFNLSTAGSIQLLLIVLLSLRGSFREAAGVSLLSVASLNFLFTEPLFRFTVAAPENWVALGTFEATALLVSALSSKVRSHAAQAECQRARMSTLFELSRAILLIDPRRSACEQLAALIRELIVVEDVDLWHEESSDEGSATGASCVGGGLARATFVSGRDGDDGRGRVSRRVLRLGTTPIGAMVLRGWEMDALMADAVASLAAVALERARSIEKESRAEAERQTEQLRTTVLDSLAHAFKTPLTGILTASSGLLAVGELTATQAELVGLIDQEGRTLNSLTTRLLQTAALESREIRLRRSAFSIAELAAEIVEGEERATRERVVLTVPEVPVLGDAQLIGSALEQLIDNAAKYGRVGSPIGVSALQEGSELLLGVESTGSEIRAEERQMIFDRFVRGANAAHGPTGTGLGLSIVKKTAEAHGGRAWVDCRGETTTFYFTVHNPGGG